MIRLDTLNLEGRQSVKTSVKWCVAACQDAHCVTTVVLLIQHVNPKVLGLKHQMKVSYPRRMLRLSLDASRVFTLAKECGDMALPLSLITSWYFCYAIKPPIDKLVRNTPGIRNLNTSLRNTTLNHPNLFELFKSMDGASMAQVTEMYSMI